MASRTYADPKMDQRPYPGPPKLFHVRMNSLFLILWVIDFIMFAFAVESTVTNGVGGMVLFASEVGLAPVGPRSISDL